MMSGEKENISSQGNANLVKNLAIILLVSVLLFILQANASNSLNGQYWYTSRQFLTDTTLEKTLWVIAGGNIGLLFVLSFSVFSIFFAGYKNYDCATAMEKAAMWGIVFSFFIIYLLIFPGFALMGLGLLGILKNSNKR